jgi:hypothetical protein
MNNPVVNNITKFMSQVANYLYMEYGEEYHKEYTKDSNLQRMYDFTGSYYFGGNNVPDTARYVVELIDMIKNGMA